MFRHLQLLIVGLMTVTAASAAQGNDYWYGTAQRERIHEQYLSPVEHNSLHRGMSYGAAPVQPNYQYPPAFSNQPSYAPQPYDSTYGNDWSRGGYSRPNLGFQSYPSSGAGCGRQRPSGYGVPGSFPRFNSTGW
jgi:hypothetical protein